MKSLFRQVLPPGPCSYLPHERASMEYEYGAELSRAEYLHRMHDNWRRFGHALFRPRCAHCNKCRAVRVRAMEFRPDRSQRRVRKANEGAITLKIGRPAVTREKLALYDRYHLFQ